MFFTTPYLSSSAWSYSSSTKELKKEEEKKKQHVYHGEEEANSVWQTILKKKGLPLDTPYEYVDTLDKAYDETYCDMLFITIREKKKNPEAAKSCGIFSSSDYQNYVFDFDERKFEKHVTRDVNAILYVRGSEAARKRYYLSKESSKKNDEKFKELQAKGLIPLGLFRPPMFLIPEYEE